jgi:hypothetical protein
MTTSTTPTIYLLLVDDWELSGNGSGDARELQFQPMRELVSLYNQFGIRGSFNAEVMQQLAFRRHQAEHPELKTLADEWDACVIETFRQGHDIQLHVHPQWRNAAFENGNWKLTSDWSILNYSEDEAYEMLSTAKDYLERLLRSVAPDYKCCSFRSGAWCIAPSPHMLQLLVKLGIVFDMSIVGGVRYDTRNIQLDYTNCEEDFLPYYPVMTDARQVSDNVEPIVCVPTNCFYASRREVFRQHLNKVSGQVKKRLVRSTAAAGVHTRSKEAYGMEWAQSGDSTIKRIYEKGVQPYVKGKHFISDLAQLDRSLLNEMLNSIRRRAKRSGKDKVPVILENHTKDVRDFSYIKDFLAEATAAPDLRFITLSELASALRSGSFEIRRKA